MFKFVSYSIRNIFFRDSKFISSLEKWISKVFMNNVIDDFLSRWHLKKFIKSHKNEITFNDCLKHFHKMRIRKCHFAKQRFACMIKSIIVRFVLSNLRNAKRDVWSLDLKRIDALSNKRRNRFESNSYEHRKNVVCLEIFDEMSNQNVILSRKTWS